MLAQVEREEALVRGYWHLSLIVLIGLLAVMLLVAMFLLRRWRVRQLKSIEEDRAARRAGRGEKLDAWAAGADRYVDHDKLDPMPDEDEASLDDPDEDEEPMPYDLEEEDDGPVGGDEQEDPYGLFHDKPYRDPEDEDEDVEDEDDWGDDDEDDEPRR